VCLCAVYVMQVYYFNLGRKVRGRFPTLHSGGNEMRPAFINFEVQMGKKMKREVGILYNVLGEKNKLDLHHGLSSITKRREVN